MPLTRGDIFTEQLEGHFHWTATGFDLQLTRYDERGWRATFYVTGMEPSPTSATGTAWEVLRQASRDG
jgi:hypothetical protein